MFPWLVGRYRVQQQRLISAGWERAGQLERERRIVAGQARLRERARIAQDMHDLLGHELSLIALRAAALELAADLPGPRRTAAGEIRESAAAATDRLREIIWVLRDDGDPAPLEPTLEQVEELVDRAGDSGMAVTLRRTGPADAVPPMVDRAAHRIVRESLTNATRYAPGARVVVTLAHRPDATTVTVTNDPPTAVPQLGGGSGGGAVGGAVGGSGGRPAVGSGLGLVGLRERVRLIGGTLTGSPYGGGFRVFAVLPHDGRPAVTEEVAPAAQLRHARRRVRRSLVVALVAPAALAVVMAVSYYPFAVLNAVLAADDFDRMRIGTPSVELTGVLPSRQAADRPTDGSPAAPPGSTCEFYTDGNFPLARATFRLCFAEGRLVAKDDLRDTGTSAGRP